LSKAQPCPTLCDPASPLPPLLMPRTLDKSKLFMQNKPNAKNTKTNLTPFPKKNYKDYPLPGNQKNKPNSNPILTPPKKAHPDNTQIPAPQIHLLSPDFCPPLKPPGIHQLSAKTQKKHDLFMQNKPNPKNTKTNPTLLPPMSYSNKPPRPTRKNKPNSNPIRPNPTAQIEKTNPTQTQSNPIPSSPKLPTPPKSAIRYPLNAARYPNPTRPNYPHPKSNPTPSSVVSRPSSLAFSPSPAHFMVSQIIPLPHKKSRPGQFTSCETALLGI